MGDCENNATDSVPAIQWGMKVETIAKKQYKGYKKLKFK